MFKIGDRVKCIDNCYEPLELNKIYNVTRVFDYQNVLLENMTKPVKANRFVLIHRFETLPKGNYMNEMLSELKFYIKEHKSTIYTILLVALVDHYFLEGKLRSKLQELLDSALNKAKKQLDN